MIVFIILDLIFAILAAERTLFEGMLKVSVPILLIMIPLVYAIIVEFKILDKGNKKIILWKMPLTTFIIGLIIGIIFYVWALIDIKLNGCVEFGCLAPVVLPGGLLIGVLVLSLVSYIIALVIYSLNKKKFPQNI